MTKDEALGLALEALENVKPILVGLQTIGIKAGATSQAMRLNEQFIQDRAIAAIRAALAQWTCLTDTQIHKINEDFEQDHGSLEHTRAIEAKLKELNQ